MDSSDIRRALSEVSDNDDPDDPEIGIDSDFDADILDYIEPDSDLLDFSSGSDDFYSPHTSELDTSEVEDFTVEQPTNEPGRPTPEPQIVTRDPWVRVYPPEPEIDIRTEFRARQTGPKDLPPRNSPPLDYLSLFLTAPFWQLLARETNSYAERVIAAKRDTLSPKSRFRKWTNVTVIELKKFFAILINMGLTVKNNVRHYWDTRSSQCCPFYGKQMTVNRFALISSFLHMTPARDVPRDNPNYDPWLKVRWLLDHVNSRFKRHFVASQDVCIDESLIGMKNRCAFIQYLPNKKHKQYGIKKFEVCDSNTSYVLHIEIYSGKDYLPADPENSDELFTERVVMEMMTKGNLLDKGHHLYTDNFYTKIPLAERLLERITFITGTINKKSKFLSKTVKKTKLGERETVYFRKGRLLLVGYRQKTTRKPVLVISTGYHAEDGIVRSKKGLVGRKPLLIHNYNQNMGGVDVSDKCVYALSINRQTSKYWKKIFFNLIDLALFNAYVLYKLNSDKPKSRREFHISVLESLADAGNEQVVQPGPGPGGDNPHRLEHLPRKQERKCVSCGRGRSSFWCPGCNAGIHRECFHQLQHYWRPKRGVKRTLVADDPDSD
ncbi:piggyBac transposable element-derived protein 4-like [Macrosteles quadrilineatus]|uniref:piggyBac transposable element-derived protein 4-like n=1 Tax=Macrosteles quadrilineatus TaxID=74068 RepID=UPI0023E0A22C|nr:piggyBac transposable element-derived protein 4-like [Macrosteles quadrilineatus]